MSLTEIDSIYSVIQHVIFRHDRLLATCCEFGPVIQE